VESEVDEEMRRRVLLAKGSVALFGAPLLGELLHIPERPPSPTPLPSRVLASDVTAIRNLTSELRGVARTYGGGADTISAVAARSRVLMSVPATDQIKADLSSALAELHTLAGWCCVDSGLPDHARANFATAMELAAQDPQQLALAFRHAGIQMVDAGAHNDALKAFQLGLMGASDPETIAWLHAETAFPLAALGQHDAARSAISKARQQPLADPFDVADLDYATSNVHLELGRVDTAEVMAHSSVRGWAAEGSSHRDSVEALIALASLHVRAGELDSPALASQAIDSVASLRSTRARVKLGRLVSALETRPRPELTDLARRARQVATVQV
jgi:tetratricopeptide (TPR) repeat protein